MSDYTYTDPDGDTLRLLTRLSDKRVALIARGDYDAKEIHIPNADVPTVATELLKAAGRSELAEMIEAVETERRARAEREAAEKKLQERRDAHLSMCGATCAWDQTGVVLRTAIDRIIELEDERDAA